jgi:hypothetical protein
MTGWLTPADDTDVPEVGTTAPVDIRLAAQKNAPPAVLTGVILMMWAAATVAFATAPVLVSQSDVCVLEPPVIRNVLTVSGGSGT